MNTIKTITPREAWQILQDHPNALLIDIRSQMEFLFVGHPVGALHIPWIDEPDWTINPHFVTQVRQALLGGVGGAAPVLLVCRSGSRSREAANALVAAHLVEIYVVAGGFEGDLDDSHHRSSLEGWRFHGLPWEQC